MNMTPEQKLDTAARKLYNRHSLSSLIEIAREYGRDFPANEQKFTVALFVAERDAASRFMA